MKTRIVRIGNSRGVRIPKLYIDQSGLGEEVELAVRDKEIVISPASRPRQGWAEAFRAMAPGEDKTASGEWLDVPSGWDMADWRW